MNHAHRMEEVDFSTITACGECCDTCDKMKAGECLGCIQADGIVPEWADSGRCRIHACVREHLTQLRDQYNEISEKIDLKEN